MSKFSNADLISQPRSPIQTEAQPTTLTHNLAPGYRSPAQSELFILAVTNMVSEDTYYESAKARDDRFTRLVAEVTQSDPEWLQGFIPWLRKSANMRSAPIVALAEYVRAGGPNARALIANTLTRPDEPAELLGYWMSRYSRAIPKPIKRGISDSLRHLYTERSALKYDGVSRGIRMGDVIELVHPTPLDNAQSHLFRYLLDRRHQGGAKVDGRVLRTIYQRGLAEAIVPEKRRDYLRQGFRDGFGWNPGATWEWLSGWLPGGMDAEAWEAIIPQMGYMALLRNLRNFDQANISAPMVAHLKAELSHPDNVARSRQFPYRFWSAYKNLNTLRWGETIEEALSYSLSNVPAFPGRTLVLCDVSGSMEGDVSARSQVHRYEIAAVFAAGVAANSESHLALFASRGKDLGNVKGHSVLRLVEKIGAGVYDHGIGHGTNVSEGMKYYSGEDRIVVFTDEQISDTFAKVNKVPTYIFNLGGYAPAMAATSGHVHRLGGFSDAAFKMIPLIESYQAAWPWETE